jgi:predicted SAM-dependent methyltransferase
MERTRLDIGAGPALEHGWISWDIKDGRDARKITLEDSSVDEIRASHVLEHLGFLDLLPTLKEWRRVLRPNGRLYLAVPDLGLIVYGLFSGLRDPNLLRYLMGGQVDADDFHKSAFTVEVLFQILEESGFERISRAGAEGPNTSHHWISLNVEAYKSGE